MDTAISEKLEAAKPFLDRIAVTHPDIHKEFSDSLITYLYAEDSFNEQLFRSMDNYTSAMEKAKNELTELRPELLQWREVRRAGNWQIFEDKPGINSASRWYIECSQRVWNYISNLYKNAGEDPEKKKVAKLLKSCFDMLTE